MCVGWGGGGGASNIRMGTMQFSITKLQTRTEDTIGRLINFDVRVPTWYARSVAFYKQSSHMTYMRCSGMLFIATTSNGKTRLYDITSSLRCCRVKAELMFFTELTFQSPMAPHLVVAVTVSWTQSKVASLNVMSVS